MTMTMSETVAPTDVETVTDLDSAELVDAAIIGAARDARSARVTAIGQVAGEPRAWTMGGNVD